MIRSVSVGGRTYTYTLVCSRARTTLLLQALPQGRIKLYAPAGYSLRAADRLVKQNARELDLAHARMAASARALPGTVMYEGERLNVNVKAAACPRVSLKDGELTVLTPYESGEEINAQIKRWLVRQALRSVRENLDRWAPTVNQSYGRVTVREQKTRWGSCSSAHNLNFNWKLVMAPKQALEYVVIHELCHLIYLNHSERFWAQVRQRMPDYEVWKKWLKAHGAELRFP